MCSVSLIPLNVLLNRIASGYGMTAANCVHLPGTAALIKLGEHFGRSCLQLYSNFKALYSLWGKFPQCILGRFSQELRRTMARAGKGEGGQWSRLFDGSRHKVTTSAPDFHTSRRIKMLCWALMAAFWKQEDIRAMFGAGSKNKTTFPLRIITLNYKWGADIKPATWTMLKNVFNFVEAFIQTLKKTHCCCKFSSFFHHESLWGLRRGDLYIIYILGIYDVSLHRSAPKLSPELNASFMFHLSN